MKRMLLSFIGIFMLFASLQANAMVACSYVKEPCDDKGNHYQCYEFGWSGDYEFCSETDVGQFRQKTSFVNELTTQNYDMNECIHECVNAGGAPSTCHHKCW